MFSITVLFHELLTLTTILLSLFRLVPYIQSEVNNLEIKYSFKKKRKHDLLNNTYHD